MRLTTKALIIFFFLLAMRPLVTFSCTGISLKANDGGVVVARTVEWALSDAQHNKIMIVPRQKAFVGQTPKGFNGKKWIGEYGFVTLTAYDQPYGPDGLNEEGLYVGVYYLPGFAAYAVYEPAKADQSMSVGDFMQWMLSSFKTVKDVERSLNEIVVVDVINEEFGGASLPFHFKVTDSTGESIVIEIVNQGEMKVYRPFMGVITNSPTYDWHLINLRNYLFLSPNPQQALTIDNFNLSPLGGGSGLMGLPGDFTPPSRFIRAAAFTASARPLNTSIDAVFEAFRILDNFNIPLGAQVPAGNIPSDIVSATQITTASDLKEKVFYYHTMWNREIRKIDLKLIDFKTVKEQILDDDQQKSNRTKDVTGFLIGNAINNSDCVGLKNHVWSTLKNRCLNLVESGVAFSAYNTQTVAISTDVPAYVVLSDDQQTAELFFGFSTDKPLVLTAQPIVEGELDRVIFINSHEMVKIKLYKDSSYILYRDEIRYVLPRLLLGATRQE